MKKSCMLALLVLTAATGVSAAEKDNQDGQGEPKKEKIICKSERVTGSRTKINRTCMTKSQWDALAAATKKGLDEMGRDASGGTNSAWDPTKAPGVGGT